MTRQQGGVELDYVQFGCVVQLGELTVSMTRQQGGLNLDSGWTTLYDKISLDKGNGTINKDVSALYDSPEERALFEALEP